MDCDNDQKRLILVNIVRLIVFLAVLVGSYYAARVLLPGEDSIKTARFIAVTVSTAAGIAIRHLSLKYEKKRAESGEDEADN